MVKVLLLARCLIVFLTKGNPCLIAELMLLGVISLLLSQTARWISEICVPSSLFTSRFYICSETDYEDLVVGGKRSTMEMNQTVVPNGLFGIQSQNVCSEVVGLVLFHPRMVDWTFEAWHFLVIQLVFSLLAGS
ncbi:Os11g0181400 [Oryza sativa Japonica Group]|uniref:Os11g0181400 protein n=1 Tax=Oryza sativa subsp. japonica TaxID=39947 RepID=C7J9D5_ORYSJ|nr:Os11g0181400 [Oryza sativa Japonica Group]|eukprot:NP_001176390.1 Os11g0181400 [Oryza sativa Japonica Group]